MSKHLPVLLIILFSSFLVFSGCQESVQLTTQPSGAISQMQAIPFEFSVDLAPKDQLNKWTESSFVRFTPPLSGKFIWETPRLLKFTPDMPLEPARHYSAVIQKAVLFGKKKRTDFDTLKFNTQLIEVEGVSATWSEYSSYGMKAPIELTLVFNQEIVVRELKNYLKVYCNGEEVTDLNIYGYGTDKEVRIYLEGKDNAGETQQFQLQLKAGLPSQYEYATLEKPAELTTLLHPVAEVKIQTINVEIRDGHQLLVMETNQKISPKILRSYLKVSPETPIQIENYGNKMHIKGAFKPGSLVNVSIRKGLHGLNGGELKEDFSYNLTLPDLEPFLRFTDQKGYYLMRNGFENLNVKCVNIKSFEVRLYEIYENNLSHFISENSDQFIRTDYSYDYGVDIDNYGRLMFLDSIHLPNVEKNTLQNRTINLQKQLRSKYKGLYAIELRHNSDRWERISKVVSLSDIGLISKQSPDEIIVYANALSSARPLAGARVQLRSVTNQVLATATTNGQGIARFQHLKEKLQSGPDGWVPSLITAHYGDDFNYISFRHSEVYNGRWENDGKEKKQIDAFLYPDRDLFRPGDTAHFAAILRNWDLSTPPDLPVRFQILGPSGDLVLDLKKTTNSQGSFEVQVPLSSGATTGRYRAQVLSTSKELLNSISFNIETFVPDKIKVSLGSDSKDAGPGDTLLFPLAASYYFGADCSSHSYEYRIRFQNQSFYSLNYPRFNFQNNNSAEESLSSISHSDTLNVLGQDTIRYAIPKNLPLSGRISGAVYATVFDNSGHTVSRSQSFNIITRETFLGTHSSSAYYSVNDNFQMDIIAVSKADKALKNYPLVIEVQRFDWKQSMRNQGGRFIYVSESEPITLKRDTVYLQGKPHTFRMRIRDAGNYAILVHPLDEPNYIKHVNFSAYGKEVATASSFGVDHEGQIAIALDKEKYLTGQKARLLFTTPFSGRMLVTVEREKVYQHYYLDVTNNSAELVLPIREEFAPNVVVTATLFRPQRNRRAMILTVAHGHAQLKVDNARLRLPVEIQAPERIKPGGTTYVTVKTVPQKNVFVTLAVVDEGILALKGFQTPDPFGYMYSARASEVRSFDMYKYLLPEVPSAQAATGGGVGGGSSHLLNPIQAQRFKPVAIWSGILPTNAAGKVRIPVTIPKEFNGKVRLMAVAHAGKRFGAGEAWLTIRDDVVMLPGLPRFATAGDTFTVPVTLLNTTDREGSAEVHLHLEGPLELLGSATQRVALTAKGSALLNFQVRAMDAIGVGKIQLDLSDMETRRQDFELAIRPPAPYENEGGSGSVAAGNTVSLQIPGGFYPDLHQTKIRISRFPALKMGKHLEYLLRYPHGCAEQTTSAVFPQLYFPELAELVAPDLYTSSNAVFHIREAIRKLESMQLYQGNFSYWPGGSYSNEWASIYVTHFLIEASRAGYSVNKTTLENAIAYLREHISEKSTFTYTFYRNHRPFTQTKATKEAIYGIYVLALSGSPDLPIMNYYRSHLKLLSGDSRYLLAAAFALTGDMQGFEALLPAKMEAEETDRLTGGNFDSGIRSNAMILSALIESDPNHPRIQFLIDYLSNHLEAAYSTQDRAWVFMALGKAIKRQGKTNVEVEIKVDGERKALFTGKNLHLSSPDFQGKKVELIGQGNGKVYYFWGIEGIKKGMGVKIRDRDATIKVKRTYYTPDGRELLLPMLNQGELVVCRLQLRSSKKVDNIAIVDMIPAGLEIENTRLNKASLNWVKGLAQARYMDARDDRAIYYTDMKANQVKEFAYLMRAVSQGTFLLPPVAAEAMYDPEIHSFHSGDTLFIYPPKAELPNHRLAPAKTVKPDDSTDSPCPKWVSPYSTWARLRAKIQD